MNYYILFLFVASLINISFGLLTYFKNRESQINVLFSLIAYCLSFWGLFLALTIGYLDTKWAEIFNKLIFLGPFILPSIFIKFSHIFPYPNRRNIAIEGH